MKEHFKGVLWPRQKPSDGKQERYRYVIVGMLVTDEPLDIPEAFENESVIDTDMKIAKCVEVVEKRLPYRCLGDAVDVLFSLKEM